MNNLSVWQTVMHVFEFHPILGALGVLMLVDITSGWLAAGVQGHLNSKTSWAGMLRKTMTVLLIGMAAAVERAQPDVPLVKLTCMFFLVTEGLSIIENAKRAGVPIPMVLNNALSTLDSKSAGNKDVHLEIKGAKIDAKIQETGDSMKL